MAIEPPDRTPAKPRPTKPVVGPVQGDFKMIFTAVVGFTAFFAIAALFIAFTNRGANSDEGLKGLQATFVQLLLVGFGTIAGLLGGKNAR